MSPLFSLERGDFVILRYSYSFLFPSSPPEASLDLGLLDSSGRFFSINVDVEGGRISQMLWQSGTIPQKWCVYLVIWTFGSLHPNITERW